MPGLRFAKLRQAEEILIQDAPILPIYWCMRVYLLDPAVTGWYPNLRLGILSNSLIFNAQFRCADADLFVAPSCSSFL